MEPCFTKVAVLLGHRVTQDLLKQCTLQGIRLWKDVCVGGWWMCVCVCVCVGGWWMCECVGEVPYSNHLSGNTSKGLTVREKYSMYMWVYMKTSNYSRSSNKCALK